MSYVLFILFGLLAAIYLIESLIEFLRGNDNKAIGKLVVSMLFIAIGILIDKLV